MRPSSTSRTSSSQGMAWKYVRLYSVATDSHTAGYVHGVETFKFPLSALNTRHANSPLRFQTRCAVQQCGCPHELQALVVKSVTRGGPPDHLPRNRPIVHRYLVCASTWASSNIATLRGSLIVALTYLGSPQLHFEKLQRTKPNRARGPTHQYTLPLLHIQALRQGPSYRLQHFRQHRQLADSEIVRPGDRAQVVFGHSGVLLVAPRDLTAEPAHAGGDALAYGE